MSSANVNNISVQREEAALSPCKKARQESNSDDKKIHHISDISNDPLLLDMPEIWVAGILPFVGPGHFIFVAMVNKRLKELYQNYFSTIKQIPLVRRYNVRREGGFESWSTRQAQAFDSFYSVAFSNISCAKYWNGKDNDRSMNVCAMIAKHGSLQVLQWAHQNGFPWDEYTIAHAAWRGELSMMKYAHQKGCCIQDTFCTAWAAFNGHLHVLEYLHEHGCPWNESACGNAAHNGHVKVLKWLRSKGCPWDKETCQRAAGNGHIEMLKWAHSNGCPWDERTCSHAARNGHLDVLKWAHSKGCPWNENTCKFASRFGHLEVLQWARDNGCPE